MSCAFSSRQADLFTSQETALCSLHERRLRKGRTNWKGGGASV